MVKVAKKSKSKAASPKKRKVEPAAAAAESEKEASKRKLDEEGSGDEKASEDAPTRKRLKAAGVTIIDRLRGEQPGEALKEISTATGEVIPEFLDLGGQADDLLRILNDKSKTKSPEVALVFQSVEAIILHIAAGESKHKNVAMDLVRKVLLNHFRYIILLLSPTNTAYQAKSCLRLLAAMVACGVAGAREVLVKMDFEHKNFDQIVKRRSKKGDGTSGPDVRTCFIHFLLAFFVTDNSGIIKDFLEKRNNQLAQIFPDLKNDSCETVTLVLTTLREKLIENANVSKTSKMKTFSVSNLGHLLQLFHWRGTANHDQMGEDEQAHFTTEREMVTEATAAFFKSILTSTKLGVVFSDPTCGTSGKNLNLLLLNLLKSIRDPWEHPKKAELIADALRTCPDQVRPFLETLGKHWEPRLADSWLQLVDFLFTIFRKQNVSEIFGDLDQRQTKLIASVLANVGCPERVAKAVILPALEDESDVVRRKGIELLDLLLGNVVQTFCHISHTVKKSVVNRLTERVPSAKLLVQIWDSEISFLSTKAAEDDGIANLTYLTCTSRVIDFAMNHFPSQYPAADVDVQKMLDQLLDICREKGRHDEKAVYDIKLILLHHLSNVASDSMREEANLCLLLTVYASSDDDKSRNLAAKCLVQVMTREDVLSKSEMSAIELEVWLFHLPNDNEVIENLAKQLSKLVSEEEKEDTMRLFIKHESVGLNPVSLGLLIRSEWKGKKKSAYLKAVLQSLFAIHDDPEGLVAGLTLLGIPSALPKASSIEPAKEGNGEFKDLMSAFRLLLALRSSKDTKITLEQLEEFLKQAKGGKQIAKTLLRQTYVRSLFQPLENEASSNFVLSTITLSGMAHKDDCYYRDAYKAQMLEKAFSSESFVSSCYYELLDTSFDTLRLDASALEELLLRGLDHCQSRGSVLEMTCLGAVMRAISKSKSVLTEEAEKECFQKLPLAVIAACENGACALPAVSPFLDFYSPLCESFSDQQFIVVCKSSDASGVLEVLTRHSPRLASAMLKHASQNTANVIEHFTVSLVQSLKTSRADKKLLKSLRTILSGKLKESLNEDKSTFSSSAIELLRVLCTDYELDLSSALVDVDCSDFDVLRVRYFIASSGKSKAGSFLSSHVLWPSLKLCAGNINSSETRETAVSISKLITTVSSALLAKQEIIEDRKDQIALWRNYVKAVLKNCLKSVLDDDTRAVHVTALSLVCQLLYNAKSEEDKDEAGLIYSMVYGHSNFVSLMLDSAHAHSASKTAIVGLIVALMKIQPSVCNANQIPLFLGAYHGTLSASDQTILKIIFLHEESGVSLAEFKPVMWGQTAVGHYSVRQKGGVGAALWKVPKASEILSLIEPERMFRSAAEFPLRLHLQPDASQLATDDRTRYDPRFFLPLFCQLCAPGAYIDRHLHLVECGAMALIFASLSSRQKLMRQVGYTAMARLYHQLESAKLTAEKKVWLHLVDIVRNGVRASKSPNMTTLKVPAVVTAFLAKICLVLRSPLDPMYKSMSSFVLAKPTMDLFKVPEFSRLFHSSELNHEEERHWLLLVLRDGLREELDYSVAQKDFFSKLLLCYHDCSMADEGSKSLIRQTMARVAEIKEPAYDLVRHHGLLTWIATQCMKYLRDAKATAELGKIATNAWKSMSGGGDENSKMPTTVLDEFSLTLDTLAAASAMVGEKTTLKSVVDALKMISLKKSLVSERQIMVYSQILG